jgi:hypothetical protein
VQIPGIENRRQCIGLKDILLSWSALLKPPGQSGQAGPDADLSWNAFCNQVLYSTCHPYAANVSLENRP